MHDLSRQHTVTYRGQYSRVSFARLSLVPNTVLDTEVSRSFTRTMRAFTLPLSRVT